MTHARVKRKAKIWRDFCRSKALNYLWEDELKVKKGAKVEELNLIDDNLSRIYLATRKI